MLDFYSRSLAYTKTISEVNPNQQPYLFFSFTDQEYSWLPRSIRPLLFQLLLCWPTKVERGRVSFQWFVPYCHTGCLSAHLQWIMATVFWRWIQRRSRWQMGPVPADSCQVRDTFTTIAWQGQANSSRQMQPCDRGGGGSPRLEA